MGGLIDRQKPFEADQKEAAAPVELRSGGK